MGLLPGVPPVCGSPFIGTRMSYVGWGSVPWDWTGSFSSTQSLHVPRYNKFCKWRRVTCEYMHRRVNWAGSLLNVTGSTRTSAQEGQLNSWVSPHPPLQCDSWYPPLHLYGLIISDSQVTLLSWPSWALVRVLKYMKWPCSIPWHWPSCNVWHFKLSFHILCHRGRKHNIRRES
jgi:hypothetical protein